MYYIAYGSNLNLEQMAFRCPNSKIVGTGKLRDWQLVFNYHADIIEAEEEGSIVPILVWDVPTEDWASLDRYEGFPRYYVKKTLITCLDNGTWVQGVAYVMARNRKGFDLPSWDYFNTILTGYRENELNERFLDEALIYTKEMIGESEDV